MPEPPEALNLKPFRGLSETAGVITELLAMRVLQAMQAPA